MDHDDAPWFWIFDNAIFLPARYAWRANSAFEILRLLSMPLISFCSSGVKRKAIGLRITPLGDDLRRVCIACKVQLVTSY